VNSQAVYNFYWGLLRLQGLLQALAELNGFLQVLGGAVKQYLDLGIIDHAFIDIVVNAQVAVDCGDIKYGREPPGLSR
jgi:hypothetical protein